MVSKQEVELTIKPDGTVELTVKGVKGQACEDVAKLFGELGTTTRDERTAEYYEREGQTNVRTRTGQ